MIQATQLDEISEDDIVAALSSIETDFVPSLKTTTETVITPSVAVDNTTNDLSNIKLDSSNAGDIIELLKQLIDGKTLEISIKVKN